MIRRKMSFFKLFQVSVLFVMAVLCTIPHNAMALDDRQRRLIDKNILYYNIEDCNVTGKLSAVTTSTLNGNDNVSKVYNYLTSKGLTKPQAGGIMANLNSESGINPKRVQGAGVIEADEITLDGHTGYGLAQWTDPGRQRGLKDAADSAGKSTSDLGVQLDYLWHEFTTSKRTVLKDIKTMSDYAQVTNKVMTDFEGPQVNNGAARVSAFQKTYDSLPEPSGAANTDAAGATTGSTSPASCTCATTDPSAAGKKGRTIAIDAGHGPSETTVDSATKLKMVESNNQPENDDVWVVAQKLKKKLEKAGYDVIMTKESVNESVTFRQRAQRADDANADLALSIHGDPNLPNEGQIYPQKVGEYRGAADNKTAFSENDVAKQSQQFSEIFKTERAKVEGSDIIVKDNDSFDGRPGLEPGNLSMVQLFSKTPWVYNEAKMSFDTDKYVDGLFSGVEQSINSISGTEDESNDTGGPCATDSGGNGDVIGTAINYAWPTYHPADYLTMKDTYRAAIKKAISAGKYVGGGPNPGVDCGGFVTRVMQDSGADPEYGGGGNTDFQKKYMDRNKDKYENLGTPSSISTLQPGDIAINDTHTYMYVGAESQHPDFHGNSASASYAIWRTPMASNATDFSHYTWYRLKK